MQTCHFVHIAATVDIAVDIAVDVDTTSRCQAGRRCHHAETARAGQQHQVRLVCLRVVGGGGGGGGDASDWVDDHQRPTCHRGTSGRCPRAGVSRLLVQSRFVWRQLQGMQRLGGGERGS